MADKSETNTSMMEEKVDNGTQDGKNAWDDEAEQYSANITRFTSVHASDLIGCMYKDIENAKTILDIGCGPGAFGIAYLHHFPNGIANQKIICTDLSPGMVHKCQQVIEQHIQNNDNFQTEFVFQVEDGTKLDGIDDGTIDVVVSIFGVFLIPDQASTMKSIRRVLKKATGDGMDDGGVFGTAAWTDLPKEMSTALGDAGFGVGFHASIEQSLKELAVWQIPPGTKVSEQPSWKQWFSPDRIQEMLKEDPAGFESISIKRSIHSVSWPSTNRLWGILLSNPMIKAKDAPEEIRMNSKRTLVDLVSTDGRDDTPALTWTASNLVIAK